MKNAPLVLTTIFFASTLASSSAFATETSFKGSKIESLEEYKDGVLQITMDTCGGTIKPVVTFKVAEEIVNGSMKYGAYFASIQPSRVLAPDSMCPYMMPSHFELNLVELLKSWAHSPAGTQKARLIFENNGQIEIVVPKVTTTLRLTTVVK